METAQTTTAVSYTSLGLEVLAGQLFYLDCLMQSLQLQYKKFLDSHPA